MQKLVVLTGAGISAESGLPTFRDSNGLWKQYRFEEIASIGAWHKSPNDVLDFYNMRRRKLLEVEPNAAHYALASLETKFDVCIVTQNVDNLHERAGSTNIVHLHGELTKARSEKNSHLVTEIGYRDILWGEKASDGSRLRPHIVWFGEEVPMLGKAINRVEEAQILLIVGTSLQVYPAASLIHYAQKKCRKIYLDKNASQNLTYSSEIECINGLCATQVPLLVDKLLSHV
jgi:NAD-dependent deacetylase